MLIVFILSLAIAFSAAPACGQDGAPVSGARASSPSAKVPDVESVLRILPPPSGLAQVGEIKVTPSAKVAGVDPAAGDYGVIEIGSVSFGRAGAGAQMTVDLSRLPASKNAFGIFRSKRAEGAEALTIGAEGAWMPGVMTFWQGPYYARIAGEAPRDSILACARTLSGILPTAGDTLIEMGLFPRAAINGTERWIPRSFLGIKGLNDVWTATCSDSAGTFEVLYRFNRPPLREEEVGKVGKIVAKATEQSPIQMIDLAGSEKGKVLLLVYKKMSRYAAGYVGPKPSSKRVTFISNWVDQLPHGRTR